MSNKLSISMAALAIGIAVASCGENEGPTSKQSGSTAPEPQQTPSAQAEQPGAEKQAKQSTPAEPEQAPPGRTVSQPPPEQQQQLEASQQKQAPQVAEQQPSTAHGQAPSGTVAARTEAQPTQPQQSQAQAQPPQPQQNQQATATPAPGPLNLTRDQILQAQRLLSQKGFDVGDIDGIIGPRTRRAVVAFQRQQSLEPSGQIDGRTASALGLSIASTSRNAQ